MGLLTWRDRGSLMTCFARKEKNDRVEAVGKRLNLIGFGKALCRRGKTEINVWVFFFLVFLF